MHGGKAAWIYFVRRERSKKRGEDMAGRQSMSGS